MAYATHCVSLNPEHFLNPDQTLVRDRSQPSLAQLANGKKNDLDQDLGIIDKGIYNRQCLFKEFQVKSTILLGVYKGPLSGVVASFHFSAFTIWPRYRVVAFKALFSCQLFTTRGNTISIPFFIVPKSLGAFLVVHCTGVSKEIICISNQHPHTQTHTAEFIRICVGEDTQKTDNCCRLRFSQVAMYHNGFSS